MTIKPIKLKTLILYVVVTFGFGILGSLLGGDTEQVYASLIKPPLSPPGIVFPIVWSILYALMGTGAYILSTEHTPNKSVLLKIYWLQLALNALWPFVFWRLQSFYLAAIIVAILLLTVFLTLGSLKINKVSALLFVPYILWLLFAFYLNISIAVLN